MVRKGTRAYSKGEIEVLPWYGHRSELLRKESRHRQDH